LLPYEFLKIHDKDWVWWVTKLTVSFWLKTQPPIHLCGDHYQQYKQSQLHH
jgi:hypothetical protein